MKIVSAFFACGLLAFGQAANFDELAKLFHVDPQQPQDAKLSATGGRQGVRIFDFSFASPVSGRAPGVLVIPDRRGRFPVLLFGHWMMAGSPMRNHTEFLEGAIVYARAGAVCLLLDTPLVRPGVAEDPDWTHGQEPSAALQMTREWRKALDILLLREDVDPQRLAYVGHSFSAGVGARLAGVEKRIQSFVLRKFPWEELAVFVSHAAPSGVFLQNGRTDKELPERVVRKSLAYFNGPKQIEFYDAGHALNSAARLDRARWLRARLKLKGLDWQALRAIGQLR